MVTSQVTEAGRGSSECLIVMKQTWTQALSV